jgi:hypothetical protein
MDKSTWDYSHYVSNSLRSKVTWRATGAKLGIEPEEAKELYFETYFSGMSGSDFHDLVSRGEITLYELTRHVTLAKIRDKLEERRKSPRKIDSYLESPTKMDTNDRLDYRLGLLLRVGDEVEALETMNYLSGGEYITKGKRYRIARITQNGGLHDWTLVTSTNLPEEVHYQGLCSLNNYYRNGILIWSRSPFYIDDHMNYHPHADGWPLREDDVAALMLLGLPVPPYSEKGIRVPIL